MKPLKPAALALLTALCLAACAGAPEESVPAPAPDVTSTPAAESAAPRPEESTREETEPAEAEETGGIAFPRKVLVDEAGVRITAREFVREEFAEDGIRLLIENENPETILIECPLIAVNGYQLAGAFTAEVAGGKKLNTVLRLPSAAMKLAEIGEIHAVSAAFAAYEREAWRTVLLSDEAVIFDDGTKVREPGETGAEIFSGGGVKAYARMVVDDPLWGTGIALYFVNEGPLKVYCEAKNLSVDGYMLEGYWGAVLWPGKRAVGKIYLLDSDLMENDIEDPQEAELYVELCDPDTMQDIMSGTGRFKVK